MRPFIVSTDSTADIPEDYLKQHSIQLHPLHYIVDGVEYGAELEQGEIPIGKFYEMIEAGTIATTNATNVGYDIELFEKAAKEGFDVLHIAFASYMSGSYNNAKVAAEQVMEENPGCRIIVIDSTKGSGGTNLLVRKAVEMKEDGRSLEETAAWTEEAVKRTSVFFSVPSLMSLYRGGRLKKSAAILGTILKIQPTLYIDEKGCLTVLNKVRGRKAALDFLCETLKPLREKGTLPKEIAIEHGNCLEEAEALGAMAKERYGIETVYYNFLCPTLGSHTGQGIITFSFIENEK
jgi:DegV family protein with EDD domain